MIKMMKTPFSVLLLLIGIGCFSQAHPTYFVSDSAANKTVYIKQNHVKKEDTYVYVLDQNIWKSIVIKDSVLIYTCTYNDFGRALIRQHFFPGRNFGFKDSLVYNTSEQLTYL